MSKIRIISVGVQNYRSFGEVQKFQFPNADYKKPVAIIGYNNAGKTNLMNAIKFGLYERVSEETFGINDFHNCNWENTPVIKLNFSASVGNNFNETEKYRNEVDIQVKNQQIVSVSDKCNQKKSSVKWLIKQNAPIFYINFHKIKEEISTKKTSWGNLTSFLAKHIRKLVENDENMKGKKVDFHNETELATKKVLEGSELDKFISVIRDNYSTNLRNNKIDVRFGLPHYEDIFLQMLFKIGLNDDSTNLIPIDHFGDGYISMFVMAVIQAIAESQVEDECLFLFEEPESFLHENHQEYFYKMVLCGLSEKGHQVIYTTHSDKMVDIFNTEGLIRIEFDDDSKQTVKKYNQPNTFLHDIDFDFEETRPIINISNYNSFIKSIEPNLNKILFSRKVILVEGPNDLMAYKFAIEKKVFELKGDRKYAETYLNFQNIAILVHHGKATASLLIELCKHMKLDYFVINDWDFDDDFVEELSNFNDVKDLQTSNLYCKAYAGLRESISRGQITTNWKLIKAAGRDNIHFNIRKLEIVLDCNFEDKSSIKIWEKLNRTEYFSPKFFPTKLESFLEFEKLRAEMQTQVQDKLVMTNIQATE